MLVCWVTALQNPLSNISPSSVQSHLPNCASTMYMTPFLDLWSYESHTGTSWPVCKAQTFETPSNTKDEISNSLSSLQHSRLFRTSLTSTTWMSTEFHERLTKISYRAHRSWHYLVTTDCKEISTPVPAGRKQSCWSFPPWWRRWHPPGGICI